MPSPFIGGRIPQELHNTLQRHIAESGEKLSQILQQALAQYLNYTQPIENQTGLEQRVERLEASFRELAEAFAQIQEKPASGIEAREEEIPIPNEQLSILESKTDIRVDSIPDIEKIDESEEIVISTDNQTDIGQDGSPGIEKSEEIVILTDNQTDIRQDGRVAIQLETITPEEMARRSGLTIGTLRTYMAAGKTVNSKGFLYSPVKSKKKGESVWSVEPDNF